ncbi:MAG TPA: DUF2057 family protein [Marinobacter sp.]|nr:DUF2057 family protein [Marinobacter sp.]
MKLGFRAIQYGVILISLFMVGCASSVTRVNTWEGTPAGAEDPAVLKAPGEIQVLRVNGQSMTNFLIDDLALDYGLLPGENEVVFTYKTIWAKSGVVRNGESKVHIVESAPQVVRFDATAGSVYEFEYPVPESRQEAEALMVDFSADIVTAGGQTIASSSAWDGRSTVARARTPVPATSADSRAAGGDTLEQMKALWAEASEEEKRTFLRWAFE